jgi:hypothetical protein
MIGSSCEDVFFAGEYPDIDLLRQDLSVFLIRNNNKFRLELFYLIFQEVNISMGDQSDDIKPVGKLCHNVQSLGSNRSGGT